MGSVKDLEVLREPTPERMGLGRFHFSDRYSVFDWGEMPDHIPLKGAAITIMSAYFFEKLQQEGTRTHYRGVVEGGVCKRLSEVIGLPSVMEIDLVRVLKPVERGGAYDYAPFRTERGNFLIPLEVIYRNSLPAGSSVFKRIERGELSSADLGIDGEPVPGMTLSVPFLDVSTKLEITDRYISWEEAERIAGLSREEMERIRENTLKINGIITAEFMAMGLRNEDGKFEFGFSPEREILVLDVLGTLDECRFTYEGMPVSKEIARIYYRKTPWFREVEEAKRRDRMNWKSLVSRGPDPLPQRLRELISHLYISSANALTGREWVKGIPPLRTILEEIKGYIK